MARSFTGTAESTAAVSEIHAAFGHREYWLDRLTGSPAETTLDALDIGEDGTVAVHYTQYLGRQLMPGAIARLVPGDVTMRYRETWRPEDRRMQGDIDVTVSGGLGSCTGRSWLAPTAAGARMSFEGRVEVRLPLVGGKLEKTIGADLAANIPSVMAFTTTWIANRG
ncbi:DUF2505 domain-containing protein [Mycolicibacterium sp. F2034L]|uniref:DUF2505 domain-containing protein n=1 Tax=Mycolicibacterium sp. F2034L TaxID=2926422 RepID=UPI001FF566B8|nr:DUF2505 domain-containing protein [Mycolicibacterium sp. F2034L]MCK0173994.1 DUF2505 domain-containing protein [Mycolicibacterium sp. F2034L]